MLTGWFVFSRIMLNVKPMFYFSPQPIDRIIMNLPVPVNAYLSYLFLFFYLGIYSKMPHSQTTGNLQKSNTGDLSTGRAFDSGCICVQSSEGIVNDLTGKETVCHCGVSLCTTITKSSIVLIPLLQICDQSVCNYQVFVALIY